MSAPRHTAGAPQHAGCGGPDERAGTGSTHPTDDSVHPADDAVRATDGPRVLVAVDIEGIAGVWRPEQTRRDAADPSAYEAARRWMSAEADAAVRGAFDGGAAEVLVNDSHGSFVNLLPDLIDPRAQLVQGKPRLDGMMAGLRDAAGAARIDGLLLIGWHARAGSRGVLAHTTNSFAFAEVLLDDRPVGEFALYAGMAAEHGVPVWLASGCDAFDDEVRALDPSVETVVVKHGSGARSGRSLSPAHARDLIHDAARRAVQRRRPATALLDVLRPPSAGKATGPQDCAGRRGVRLRVRCAFAAMADQFELWPTLRRVDAVTVDYDARTITEAVRVLNALSAMSMALR